MVGYVRQATADILPGEDVTAEPLYREFNRLAQAFGTTGHSHDGTLGNAPPLPLSTSVTGFLSVANGGTGGRNNNTAVAAPTSTDDASKGYVPGSSWINTASNQAYLCVSNQTGAAIWNVIQAPTGTFLTPGNNLNDVSNIAQARDNLGLEIGSDVQAFSTGLTQISSPTAADQFPYSTGIGSYTFGTVTNFGRSLISSNTASVARNRLGITDAPVLAPIELSNPTSNSTVTGTQTFTAKLIGYTNDTVGYYSDYGYPQASRTLNIYTTGSPNTVFKTQTVIGVGNSVTSNLQTLGLSVSTNYLAELVLTDVLNNSTKTAKVQFTTPSQFKPNIGEAYEGGFLAYEQFGDGQLFDLVTGAKSLEVSRVWDTSNNGLRGAVSRLNSPGNMALASGGAFAANTYAASVSIGGSAGLLAAIDEARAISFKLRPANAPAGTPFVSGGSEEFGTSTHWSSTEANSSNALRLGMTTGNEISEAKTTSVPIRPIKRIQLTPPISIGTFVSAQGGWLWFYFTDLSSGTPITYAVFKADKAVEVTRAWSTVTQSTGRTSRTDGPSQISTSSSYPALLYCGDLVHGGKDDWYLGAIDENLAGARTNSLLPAAQQVSGKFWSSTEIDVSNAKVILANGTESQDPKSTVNVVVPIRRVPLSQLTT